MKVKYILHELQKKRMRLLNKINELDTELAKNESLIETYKRRQTLFIQHARNTLYNNKRRRNKLILEVLSDCILETDRNKQLDLAVKAVQMEYWDHTRRFKVRKGV